MREVEWLDGLQGSGIRPGLQRMRRLLAAAGNPHKGPVPVIVAGTNGKGSTAAMVASILEASGPRTGLYTSPHLVSLNERWRIGGRDVGDAELRTAIRRLQRVSAVSGIRPTYFEALTLLAFLLFAGHECDVAVLEVGMGGRLDATNVVRPAVSIITNIALDHREHLGNTIRRIAREKAGVIHRGSVALTAADDPRALEVIARRCAKLDVPLQTVADSAEVLDVRTGENGMHLKLRTRAGTYDLHSPLAGDHQVGNIALAILAAETLRSHFQIPHDAIQSGIAQARWSGRGERFRAGSTEVIVDGAHNPAGAEALARLVTSSVPGARVLLFAAMRDKEWRRMLATLAPLAGFVVCTTADPERGADPRELAAAAGELGLKAAVRRDPLVALKAALAHAGTGAVVVAGSLYLAGAVLPWLRANGTKIDASATKRSESESPQPTATRPRQRPKRTSTS